MKRADTSHVAPLPDSPGLRADPLADETIARILGSDNRTCQAPPLGLIGLVNREIAGWRTNSDLQGWRAAPDVPEHVARALEDYLAAALQLPQWADAGKIARAEEAFFDMSILSCTLLFCASLPECYVLPDLAEVLHAAGQLEQHTDYRIRATAAMIFAVMMHGGLTSPDGGGVAQTLKVRLIHATIRHLILRGSPSHALAGGDAGLVPARATQGGGLYDALFARGWDVERLGLPCNQEELAYTLLTFHYVFLRGLRRLGLALSPDDESAYLHAWNVTGHLLGIEPELMPQTMDQAESMFERFQARVADGQQQGDPRPALAGALIRMMQDEIPIRILKPFPVLLTRYLCGSRVADQLGLDGRVGLLARALFACGMGLTRLVDTLVRLVVPGFSIARLVTRIVGYRFTVRVLMDQTRPLKLPSALLGQVQDAMREWHTDPKAPRWMNKIEQRFTAGARPAPPKGPR
jgi:hypothetical protein